MEVIRWIRKKLNPVSPLSAINEMQRQAAARKLASADLAIELMENLKIERRIVDVGVPRYDRREPTVG